MVHFVSLSMHIKEENEGHEEDPVVIVKSLLTLSTFRLIKEQLETLERLSFSFSYFSSNECPHPLWYVSYSVSSHC